MQAEVELTVIDVALDIDPTSLATITRFKGRLGEPRISLIRCVALTRHLGNIASATGRVISNDWLRGIHVPIIGRTERSLQKALVTIVAQPTAELFDIQRRVLKAIAPGTVSGRTANGVALTVPDLSIVFLPVVTVNAFAPITAVPTSASIYEVDDGLDASPREPKGSRVCKLLWTRDPA